MKHSFSIKTKLMVSYLTILCITLTFFTAIALHNADTVIRRSAQRNVDQILSSAYRNIMGLVDDINYEVLSLQSNKTIQAVLSRKNSPNTLEDISTLEDELLSHDTFNRKTSSFQLYVLDHEDYPSIFDMAHVFSSREMRNDLWFQNMLQGDATIKWVSFDNKYSPQSYIAVSKKIINTNSSDTLAVVKAIVDVNSFTGLIESLRLAENGRLFLSTDSHIIHPDLTSIVGDMVNNREFFSQFPLTKISNLYIELDGQPCLVSTHPLGNTGLYMSGIVILNEFKEYSRPVLFAILPTALLMFFIFVLLLAYISKTFVTPIQSLSKNMDDFHPGMEPALPKLNSNDEIGGLYHSFHAMSQDIKKLLEDTKTQMNLRRSAELKVLQTQITPHFLYNALNSITAMAQKHNDSDIENTITALATFFKRSLNDGIEGTTIRNELEHVKSYVQIQKIRFPDKFDFEVNVDEAIMDYKICKLTIQPLVENCIVHAFDGINRKGLIQIKGYCTGDDIYIEIVDNGLGVNVVDIGYLNKYVQKEFDPNEPVENYGIHNVNQRIRLYYGGKYGLSYIENMQGLIARIHISKQNYFSSSK